MLFSSPQVAPTINSSPRFAVRADDVSYAFGRGERRTPVLESVNIDLKWGERVILAGPSGSGKTTLLTMIGGLRQFDRGQLEVLGHSLSGEGRSSREALRSKIGFIFQHHNLLETLTALENVEMGILASAGLRASERRERAQQALIRVGLSDRAHHRPDALSGGQRQRVAIARGIVRRPKLILADEPTASLDSANGRQVANLLAELTSECGSTLLMVTHDSRIYDLADRIIELEDGRIR